MRMSLLLGMQCLAAPVRSFFFLERSATKDPPRGSAASRSVLTGTGIALAVLVLRTSSHTKSGALPLYLAFGLRPLKGLLLVFAPSMHPCPPSQDCTLFAVRSPSPRANIAAQIIIITHIHMTARNPSMY